MKSFDLVQGFSIKISTIVNQIRALGEGFPKQKTVEKVLRSLPPKSDQVVATIEESKDFSKYSLVELIGSLESHKEWLKG